VGGPRITEDCKVRNAIIPGWPGSTDAGQALYGGVGRLIMTLRESLVSLSIGLGTLGLSGCGLFGSPIEGTWVFQWDRGGYQEVFKGDLLGCKTPNDDGYPSHRRDGNDYSFVEIYTVRGQGIVVIHEEEEFIGEISGKTFTVDAKFSDIEEYSSDSYRQYEWTWDLDGAYAKGEMTGTEDREEWVDISGTTCHYKSRRSYTAVKLKTEKKPERIAGTGGSDDHLGLGGDTGW
jgi:hypothetical protein